MNGINEIRRQNAQSAADLKASQAATWSTYNQGKDIILRYGVITRVLDDPEEVKKFHKLREGKNPNQTRVLIEGIFRAWSASLPTFALAE